MQRLKIKHTTLYTFPEYVTLLPHKVMLRPREGHEVRILSFNISVSPSAQVKMHRDIFDNTIAMLNFSDAANKLEITSDIELNIFNDSPLDFVVEDYAVNYPFQYAANEFADMHLYLDPYNQYGNMQLREWIGGFWFPGQVIETYVLLRNMCKAINLGMVYKVREEEGVQTPQETLDSNSGSCRDFTNLFMCACRALGLAARFVSGYLFSPVSEAQMGSTHAWAEVYLPGAGWKGFDPTIGELVGSDHIPVAVAARADSVPPVSGGFVGTAGLVPELKVTVSVNEIDRSIR